MNRGDVVVADFPFQDAPGSKVRPALVVQNDGDNLRLDNTILAMITGNIRGADRTTNAEVNPASDEGKACGLHGQSLIKCGNLATVHQKRVLKVIGKLSAPLMAEVNAALKAALALPGIRPGGVAGQRKKYGGGVISSCRLNFKPKGEVFRTLGILVGRARSQGFGVPHPWACASFSATPIQPSSMTR